MLFMLTAIEKGYAVCAGIQRRGMNLKAVAPGGEAAMSDRARLAHMRSKVMPTQEKFDPIVYLGTVHWVRSYVSRWFDC